MSEAYRREPDGERKEAMRTLIPATQAAFANADMVIDRLLHGDQNRQTLQAKVVALEKHIKDAGFVVVADNHENRQAIRVDIPGAPFWVSVSWRPGSGIGETALIERTPSLEDRVTLVYNKALGYSKKKDVRCWKDEESLIQHLHKISNRYDKVQKQKLRGFE